MILTRRSCAIKYALPRKLTGAILTDVTIVLLSELFEQKKKKEKSRRESRRQNLETSGFANGVREAAQQAPVEQEQKVERRTVPNPEVERINNVTLLNDTFPIWNAAVCPCFPLRFTSAVRRVSNVKSWGVIYRTSAGSFAPFFLTLSPSFLFLLLKGLGAQLALMRHTSPITIVHLSKAAALVYFSFIFSVSAIVLPRGALVPSVRRHLKEAPRSAHAFALGNFRLP